MPSGVQPQYNFNNTTPAAPTDTTLCQFQQDNGTAVENISAYVKAGSSSQLGVLKNDGTTITDDGHGKISVPIATTSVPGLVKPDGATIDVTAGVISVPTATTSSLGLVKPDGATIDVSSGVISVPTATISLNGVVKPDGTTITVSGSGVISAVPSVSFGTASPVGTVTGTEGALYFQTSTTPWTGFVYHSGAWNQFA